MKIITSKLTQSQKRALTIATAFAVVFGAYFLRGYFSLLVLSIIMAFVFNPVYKLLRKKLSESSAAGLTLVISIFAILVPLFLVFALATSQVKSLSSDIVLYVSNVDFGVLGERFIVSLNNALNSIPFVDVTVTQESIINAVKNSVQTFGSAFLKYASSTVTSVTGIVTSSIIYIYIFMSIIKHGPYLLKTAKKLNPLGDEISDVYISRASAMISGTVKGQFIIALVQGFIGALTFALVGYSQFFFVLFLVFSVLSIIPLGAGILAMPLGIIMILFGQFWPGVIVLLEHVLVNSNVDNVLRPILVPKEARLDAALMLVSVFAGIRFFGFLGIVIGPTIMILIVTTIRVYLQVQNDAPAKQ